MMPSHHLLAPPGRGIAAVGRRADRGDGSFTNPVLPGDHPQPCVLQDGDDYYLSCASQQFSPGAVIWHSRDLQLPDCVDPCHVVAEDGSRHLFVNGARRVRLQPDGLAVADAPVHLHAPLLLPPTDAVHASAGPRVFRRDGWFYLLSATGGAGDPSGPHTLAVARARSVFGPWEDCLFNPLQGADDSCWTTGGAPSLVQGPAGDGWLLCHGHEAQHRTLGRQALLQRVDWD